jgi:hypothetical protein
VGRRELPPGRRYPGQPQGIVTVEVCRVKAVGRPVRFQGLIINPDGLRRCIEGNVVQVTGRGLSKEVAFDRANESSIRPVATAICNAVFDATGVRLHRAPHLAAPHASAGMSGR